MGRAVSHVGRFGDDDSKRLGVLMQNETNTDMKVDSVYIYALLEPDTGEARYVGLTRSLLPRYKAHMQDVYRKMTHKKWWIRSLVAQGKVPRLVVLDQVSPIEADNEERFYIQYLKSLGCRLVNATAGGEGLYMTPSLAKRISDSKRGRSNGLEGKPRSPDTREKLRKAMLARSARGWKPASTTKGRLLTKVHRENLSRAKDHKKREVVLQHKETLEIRVFESLNEASRALKINLGNLGQLVKGAKYYKSLSGWRVFS